MCCTYDLIWSWWDYDLEVELSLQYWPLLYIWTDHDVIMILSLFLQTPSDLDLVWPKMVLSSFCIFIWTWSMHLDQKNWIAKTDLNMHWSYVNLNMHWFSTDLIMTWVVKWTWIESVLHQADHIMCLRLPAPLSAMHEFLFIKERSCCCGTYPWALCENET